jgi:hypothetical protein
VPICRSPNCHQSILDDNIIYGDITAIKSCIELLFEDCGEIRRASVLSEMKCGIWKSKLICSFVLECILEKIEMLLCGFCLPVCSDIIIDYLSNSEDLHLILQPRIKARIKASKNWFCCG